MAMGDRIKRARIKSQKSTRKLSAEVGVSHTAICKYEKNQDIPRPSVIFNLAEALGVEPGYFLIPDTVDVSLACYRKKSKLPKKEQASLEIRVHDTLEDYLFIYNLLDREPPLVFEPYKVTIMEDVEKAAEHFRQLMEIGYDAIDNLTCTLEESGFFVFDMEAPKEFDGYCCWANQTIPVVVSQINTTGDRQRFNLAHEMGHLLLEINSDLKEEKVAHRFAGSFLFPMKMVYRELGHHRSNFSIKELDLLKNRYGISMQAIISRSHDLGIISDSVHKQLFIDFSKHGYRKKEPGAVIPVEHTKRFELMVNQALAEGLLTPVRAAQLLKESPSSKIEANDLLTTDLNLIANQYRTNKLLTEFIQEYVEEPYE